jgi:hypothetical protein
MPEDISQAGFVQADLAGFGTARLLWIENIRQTHHEGPYFVPHAAVRFELLGLGEGPFGQPRRIVEPHVNHLGLAAEDWARLVGVSADSDDVIELDIAQFFNTFRPLAGNIDTRLLANVLLRDLARQGAGVIFVSSEFPELIGLADRILIMVEGRIVGEIPAAQATEQQLMLLSSGYSVREHVAGA